MQNKYKLKLSVQEPYLSFIKSGKKTVEGRLAKEKYLKLQKDDLIKINDLEVKVVKVTKYPSFRTLILSEGIEKVIPNARNLEEAVDVYYKFYSKDDEKLYGVVGISIKLDENQQTSRLK